MSEQQVKMLDVEHTFDNIIKKYLYEKNTCRSFLMHTGIFKNILKKCVIYAFNVSSMHFCSVTPLVMDLVLKEHTN